MAIWRLAAAASAAAAVVIVAIASESDHPLRVSGSTKTGITSRYLEPAIAPSGPAPTRFATWAFRPTTLDSLVERSTGAFEGIVIRIGTGTSMQEGAPDPSDDQPIATQRVTFRVDDTIYGDLPPEVVLFKVGSEDDFLEGDPPYKVGEDYLMFVSADSGASPPGTYINLAPDGRLRVKKGRLESVIDGFVSSKLGNMDKRVVKRDARTARYAP